MQNRSSSLNCRRKKVITTSSPDRAMMSLQRDQEGYLNVTGLERSYAAYLRGERSAQEQHHAMHVLTFFYVLIRKTLCGERITRRLLGRIIHHLMDLREFIEAVCLNELTKSLCESVQAEYDNSLNILRRGIHNGLRTILTGIEHDEKQQMLRRISSFLIACSEEQKRPTICMYPWLVENEDKVLKFADFYKKRSVFEGLIPIDLGPKAPSKAVENEKGDRSNETPKEA